MEKQIKIIYRLTTIALVALILIQGYWLFNQYRYTLQKYEDELFQKTIGVIAIDTDLRRKLQDSNLQTMTQWQMNVLQNQTAISTPQTEW
ncbi:MAG: sensor histidine kinase, partial [Bacteroidales bacterium]|nr:sensor histidine kinase [Bacteroidales bacterium]